MAAERRQGVSVSVFESDRNAAIYAYYITARGERAMPTRGDIEPSRLKKHLPYVYIVQALRQEHDDVRFRITLMGSELVEVLKQNGTGRFIRELDLGGFEHVWRDSILSTFNSGRPVVALDRLTMKSGLEIDLEHLVLPLSEDGKQVDRIFGCFDFPRRSDAWIKDNLEQVEWSDSIQVEVPKRLLITNLDIPIE